MLKVVAKEVMHETTFPFFMKHAINRKACAASSRLVIPIYRFLGVGQSIKPFTKKNT